MSYFLWKSSFPNPLITAEWPFLVTLTYLFLGKALQPNSSHEVSMDN
ncbi:unnamed protein product, partial [marine sediment metagenome]